ncbi:aminoacyl-tRNA hydrolase [Malassezia sp. CBS 17886]|nr:aminoacyl-tRNA hydrolase [Malassezia sp. CBS 17886]
MTVPAARMLCAARHALCGPRGGVLSGVRVGGPAVTLLHTTRGAASAWADADRRAWIDTFRGRALRPGDVALSFARSSGPGGQHVNKVNSKALAKLELGPVARVCIPAPLVNALAGKSPLYIASTHSLQAASDRHRSQSHNVQDALDKLHAEILRVAADGLVGETAPVQKARVHDLVRRDRERTKKAKQMRSLTKSGRRAKP